MGPVTGVSYTGNGDPATLLHTDKKQDRMPHFVNIVC